MYSKHNRGRTFRLQIQRVQLGKKENREETVVFCEYCGKKIADNEKFCPYCGMPVAEAYSGEPEGQARRAPQAAPSAAADAVSYTAAPTMSTHTSSDASTTVAPAAANTFDGLVLADGEVVVKQYQCANVSGAKGYMTVTNKRLMFNAYGGASRLSQEVTLSSVSGISSFYGVNFDFKKIIIAVVLGIMGLMMIFTSGDGLGSSISMIIGVILLGAAALIAFLGIKRAFMISIYAKDVNLSPIVVGEGPTTLFGNKALYALEGTRTAETDKMINELGALVQDLQTLGDHAIDKWKNAVESGDLPRI